MDAITFLIWVAVIALIVALGAGPSTDRRAEARRRNQQRERRKFRW